MTVHSEVQPERAADPATGQGPSGGLPGSGAAPTPQHQITMVKVLAVALGAAAALAAYIVGDHVIEGAAEPIAWAAGTFVAATGLLVLLAEKTGLIE
jgi:hypothetical protein